MNLAIENYENPFKFAEIYTVKWPTFETPVEVGYIVLS